MVNFGPLAAGIVSLVSGTPGNFNGFRDLAALLQGTLVVGVSQTAALNRGRHLYSAGRPSHWALAYILVMAALCNRGPLYFCPVISIFFYLLLSFSIPRLISAVAAWMSTIFLHMVWLSANLECRSEMSCTRLAGNTGRKNDAKNRHLRTIAQLSRAISSQLRHVPTIGKKLVKQQYLPHMSS